MNGTTGIGMMNVRRCTERAIGVDILIND
jgi:hypothetical protein